MVKPDGEVPRFIVGGLAAGEPESIRVAELGTRTEVHHPDIAALAIKSFGQAVEAASQEMDTPDQDAGGNVINFPKRD